MKLKAIKETGIKYIEIVGRGENISDEYKRVYFSKSGATIVENIEAIDNETLNKLELYFSKKGNAVLTAKKDNSIITVNDEVMSSYRGTSWLEEISNAVVISATGSGRLGEHTEFIATIKNGGNVIFGFNGRYEAGYTIYQNKNGKLVKNTFSNSGKYVDMFDLDEAKALAGINEICDITKSDNVKTTISILKKQFDEVEAIDECGAVVYKVKAGNLILTISNVEEEQNEN